MKLSFGLAEIIATIVGGLLCLWLTWVYITVVPNSDNYILIRFFEVVDPVLLVVVLIAAIFGILAGSLCAVGQSLLVAAVFRENSIDFIYMAAGVMSACFIGWNMLKMNPRKGEFTLRSILDINIAHVAVLIFVETMFIPLFEALFRSRNIGTYIRSGVTQCIGNAILGLIIITPLMMLVNKIELMVKNRRES